MPDLQDQEDQDNLCLIYEGVMMQEATFEVRVPATLLEFGFDQDQIQRQVNQWLVFALFTEGHISSGKAANLLNLTRVEFLTLLRQRGIAYIDYSPEELREEFKAVDTHKICHSSPPGAVA